jgi:hexosaminidase
VEISLLHDPGSWIYFPKDFIVEVSMDGKNFTKAEVSRNQPQYESLQKRGIPLVQTQARFVRVTIIPENEIPEGQPGAGHPAWLFVSEIEVR